MSKKLWTSNCYAIVKNMLLQFVWADFLDQFRRAAGYVDRILKGAGRLASTGANQVLVINLKTAKALSLAVPPSLRARADEVIE